MASETQLPSPPPALLSIRWVFPEDLDVLVETEPCISVQEYGPSSLGASANNTKRDRRGDDDRKDGELVMLRQETG